MIPLKVAVGAPSMAPVVGLAVVIRQSRKSIFLNVRSVPLLSATVMLNFSPASARRVSSATFGPIALRVRVKVAVWGWYMAPTLSASIEWIGVTWVVNVGV